MTGCSELITLLQAQFPEYELTVAYDEVTLTVPVTQLYETALALRDTPDLAFKMLIDLCGVDYLNYGMSEWQTESCTESGFDRGVVHNLHEHDAPKWTGPRFAVVYHLLSLTYNFRLRLRTFVEEPELMLDSVVDVWPAADWFEREAFDLYGILFNGHADLRRILTDYGFVGHPFRKDFPVSGHVEMRYDAASERVIYEPVSIEPRVLVPRVIRGKADDTNTPITDKPAKAGDATEEASS